MARHRLAGLMMSGLCALAAGAGLGGCAAPVSRPARSHNAPSTQGAPAAVLDAKARMTFDRLDPLPVLSAASQPAQPLQGKALKHYQAGLDFAKADQLSEAMDEFEAAIKLEPRAFGAYLELGSSSLQAGLFDQAGDALETAAGLQPSDARPHYQLGLLNYLRENYKAALPQLRYGLALFARDEDRIKPLFYLTLVLERQGYYQAAVDAAGQFETLLARHPEGDENDARWRQVLSSQAWKVPAVQGACLRKLGRMAEAVRAYEAALKLDPDRPEVQLALAEAVIETGDMHRPVELAEGVLAKDRHNANALAILSATLVADGRMQELRDKLLAMVLRKPSDLLVAQRCAAVFLKFSQYDAALDTLLMARNAVDDPSSLNPALLQVVLANSDFTAAWRSLARLLKDVGPAEQASLLDARSGVPVNPDLRGQVQGDALLAQAGANRADLLSLAVLAEVTDRPVLSERALRRLLQDDPDDVPVIVMLAERLIDQCRWQDVIAFIRPQIEKHPDTGSLYRLLGTAYDGLDDFRSAMDNFYQALKRDKQDIQAMWQAARINDRFGQSEPAVAIYQAIVSLKTDFWPAHIALMRAYLQTGRQSAAIAHARKLKELFRDVASVDLCLLIAESGRPVPKAEKIAALLAKHQGDPALLRAAGEAYLLEGNVSQAIVVLNQLLAQQPDDEDGRLLLGTALSRQMHYDLALEVVRSLLAEHPNRRIWQLAEAELQIQAGRPVQAVPILEHLLAEPLDADQKQAILERLVFAWEYAGQYDAAIDFLRQSLSQSPKDRTLQTRLLAVLVSANRRDQALETVGTWRQAEPDEPLLARLEQRLLSTQGADQAAAVLALQDWLKGPQAAGSETQSQPSNTSRARDRAESPADSEDVRADRDISLLAGTLNYEDAPAWLSNRAWLGQPDATGSSMAAAMAGQGRYVEAVELQRLISSDDVEDLAVRAQWLFLAGRRAQVELSLLPEIQQKSSEMYDRIKRLLPSYYKRLGLADLSVKATAEAYTGNREPSRSSEYANDLAYIWAEDDMNLPLAEDLARRAVAADPTNAASLDTFGWVYYKMGRFDEALTLLQRAISVPTEGADPVLLNHLGDTLWQTGRHEEAIKAWRRSVALYQEEIRTGSQRPDLAEELQAVQQKIQMIEMHRQPQVAPCADQRGKKPL